MWKPFVVAALGDGFIIHNGASLERLAAFQQAAFVRSTLADESLFPGQAEGRCRICGELAIRNEEHLPPRSASNKGRLVDVPLLETFLAEDGQTTKRGRILQGGQRGFTLCEPCNRFTGNKWVPEYQRWARAAGRCLGSRETMERLNATPDLWVARDVDFGMVYPGRFVREVISLVLSVSGGAELADRFPALRRLALGGPPEPLPPAIRLYLLLYGDPDIVRAGKAVAGDVDGGEGWDVIFLDFPPFGLFAVVDGPPAGDVGHEIAGFATISTNTEVHLVVPELRVGFGGSNLPCDYRTAGQLREVDASDVNYPLACSSKSR